jgi:hypothetical protein
METFHMDIANCLTCSKNLKGIVVQFEEQYERLFGGYRNIT